jgi:hypothetical protein
MRTEPLALTMAHSPHLQPEPTAPRDLISVHDLSPGEILSLFNLTAMLKRRPADFRGVLAGKQMVMFFEKPSSARKPGGLGTPDFAPRSAHA